MTVKNLWAPWRSQYVGASHEQGCVFCRALAEAHLPERLVVRQAERAFLLLNRFPYASGHLMAVPKRHVGTMEELTPAEVAELWSLLVDGQKALARLIRPEGFNLGINLGAAAGAGITDHLHVHLVPRWVGDSNFMPVFSDVRVMPQHLEETRLALLRELNPATGAGA